MTSSIQIIGNITSQTSVLQTLINTLDTIGVNAHAHSEDDYFYINSGHPAWHHYDTELALYESIAESPFHIVFNDGKINDAVARQIAYAMAKSRPIIMTGAPRFSKTLSPFMRDILQSHLGTFHSIKLTDLSEAEIKQIIDTVAPCDYRLTQSEKVFINSRVKAHFRHLLEEARDIYVER